MAGILRRAIFLLACVLLFLAVAMFLPAGIGWTSGWVFLSVFLLQMILAMLYLWRRNPGHFRRPEQDSCGNEGLG